MYNYSHYNTHYTKLQDVIFIEQKSSFPIEKYTSVMSRIMFYCINNITVKLFLLEKILILNTYILYPSTVLILMSIYIHIYLCYIISKNNLSKFIILCLLVM